MKAVDLFKSCCCGCRVNSSRIKTLVDLLLPANKTTDQDFDLPKKSLKMKKFSVNLAFAFLLTVSSFSSILSAVTLTASKLYISEQEPNDQLLQLDCSGFEYKYNRQVLFFANGQQIFDSITNTTGNISYQKFKNTLKKYNF